MNKFRKIVLLLLIGLFVPNIVKADCGYAVYEDYEAKVSNTNGATVYKLEDDGTYKATGEKIAYGKTVEIEYDVAKAEGTILLAIDWNGSGVFCVKASDLVNIKDFKSTNDGFKKSDFYTIVDTEVRSGPGVLYDVVGTIKADTNIMIGFDENDIYADSKAGSWVLISNGTISGYVYFEQCYGKLPITIGYKAEKGIYYSGYNDSKLNISFGDKLDVKYIIPANKGENLYYTKIGNRFEYIEGAKVVKQYNHKLIVIDLNTDKFPIALSNLNGKELNIRDYLKLNQEYQIRYVKNHRYGNIYYIEIDNKVYSFSYNSDYGDHGEYEYPIVVTDKKQKVTWNDREVEAYKLLNSEEKSIYYSNDLGLSNPKSDKIVELVQNDPKEEDDDKNSDKKEENNKNDDENGNGNLNDDENGNDNLNDDEKKEVLTIDGLSSKDYVFWCLIGALTIAVVTTVVLVIVNKKKKDRQEM